MRLENLGEKDRDGECARVLLGGGRWTDVVAIAAGAMPETMRIMGRGCAAVHAEEKGDHGERTWREVVACSVFALVALTLAMHGKQEVDGRARLHEPMQEAP